MATAPTTPSPSLSIEAIVAVDVPREFRLHPRDRVVAYTAEAAGARQLFTVSLRGGYPTQLTASDKPVSDPQWSPDGRRLAYVRDEEIWVVEVDGSRLTRVVARPGRGREPRWSPDGHRIAFLSRRRGWTQVWLIDAPVPRRGRPANEPRPPRPTVLTEAGIDVDAFAWAPDGARIAIMSQRQEDLETSQISLVDVATGASKVVAGERSRDVGAEWMADGSLLFVSDADGWFQVVRLTADGHDRIVLTAGEREHGEPGGGAGHVPLPSPDGSRFVHIEVHDGLQDLLVGELGGAQPPKRGRGRPPKQAAHGQRDGGGQPDQSVGRRVAGRRMARGRGLDRRGRRARFGAAGPVAAARSRRRARWLAAAAGDRFDAGRAPGGAGPRPGRPWPNGSSSRRATGSPSRARCGGRRARPASAGHAGSRRSCGRMAARPASRSARSTPSSSSSSPRASRSSTSTSAARPATAATFRHANHGEWGHGDVHDLIDAGRWAAGQPWSDGRLAIYGGSYGGYMVLSALVDEPTMWRAGVDLFGDSEIAESYRRGDRIGRRDLHRMMGSPDDPTRAEIYRRGSPVYRAERIEAPVLIIHGRKDKRVVPLMSEKMVEALEIEDKAYEVHWYDEEAHGWERRENRRDAFERALAFLKTHVLDEPAD